MGDDAEVADVFHIERKDKKDTPIVLNGQIIKYK